MQGTWTERALNILMYVFSWINYFLKLKVFMEWGKAHYTSS